jgi:hypothetical protein
MLNLLVHIVTAMFQKSKTKICSFTAKVSFFNLIVFSYLKFVISETTVRKSKKSICVCVCMFVKEKLLIGLVELPVVQLAIPLLIFEEMFTNLLCQY